MLLDEYLAPFIILRFPGLPAKPWPLTVAGLPAYFTSRIDQIPLPYGERGGASPLNPGLERERLQVPTTEHFQKLVTYFYAGYAVEICSITYLEGRFLVMLEDPHTDLKRLPGFICGLLVGYLF